MSNLFSNQNIDSVGSVLTEDNQCIAFNHFRKGFPQVIVIAHGFYNNKDTVLFQGIADAIHQYYDVITFDFRGLGKMKCGKI